MNHPRAEGAGTATAGGNRIRSGKPQQVHDRRVGMRIRVMATAAAAAVQRAE